MKHKLLFWKQSVEEEKEEEEVSPLRNEIIEEIQWQKQSSGKKNINEPKNIYIGNLSLDTKIGDLYELFGLRSTKYLRERCKISMPVNENTGICIRVSGGICTKRNFKTK